MSESALSGAARAVLAEIGAAVRRLRDTGETATVFIDKMGLSQEDREAVHAFLGTGGVTIRFDGTEEPVEWRESGVAGVWYGVFFAKSGNPMLETVEIARYPALAAAQQEDIGQAAAEYAGRLSDA